MATGIKHLQKEALKFDIAIYFEANGHGTVYFSPRFFDIMRYVVFLGKKWLEKHSRTVTTYVCTRDKSGVTC